MTSPEDGSETRARLDLLYETSRRLATFANLEELLGFVVSSARELFDAEGCSILLLDEARSEFYFPLVRQRPGYERSGEELAHVRVPADKGIAGWVLEHGEAVRVTGARSDSRFYPEVDARTGLKTETILCAPLRAGEKTLGVVEVLNPRKPETEEDLRLLEALAADIGVAFEKTRLYENLRREVLGLRQLCSGLGVALLALAPILGSALLLAQFAHALPAHELLGRPASLLPVASLVAGSMFLGVGRGWFRRQTP